METEIVKRDLQSLRRLYSLLETSVRNEYIPQLLDVNSQILLKQLLDSAAQELLVTQSNILAAAQLGLSHNTVLHNRKQSALKQDLIQLNLTKDGFVEEVADAIEQIETQLSALRFCSKRVDSDDTRRSCKSRSSVIPDIEDRRQSFQPPSMSGFKRHYMPMSQTTSRTSSKLPSQRRVNNGSLSTFLSSYDPSLSPDDQFRRIKSRPLPLPPLPVRSVDFKKPSQGNKKMVSMNMKPTLLDQKTETWDEDSIGTSSVPEDEELVSTEQESEETYEETGSSSGSNWETQGESVTESESGSSYSPHSDDDDSQVAASPPHPKRDKGSSHPAKKALGRLKRFKNKLGQVFHHHHHHHHHHHPHHDKEQGRKPSAWKNLQRTFHQKNKDESRKKSESKGLTTYKQQNRGGQFHALVEGLMRHRRQSKKQKHKLQSQGNKSHWWKTLKKRQGGVKFPNGRRVKLGK